MKNLIWYILLFFAVKTATAQTRVTDISQSPLSGHVKSVTIYTFRAQNHLLPDTTANAEKTVETFDDKGWALEEKMYDKNGALQERFAFSYVGDTLVQKNQFDGDGNQVTSYIFKYDNQGKEQEFDMTSEAQPKYRLAKIVYRSFYKYDDAGNIISWEQYIDKHKLTSRTTLKYNDRHQKVQSNEESFFYGKAKKSKTTYTYDNMGYLIKSETYDSDGNLTGTNNSSYENPDKYGNWLTGTSSYSGHNTYQGDFIFTNITKRVIEYY